MSDNNLIANLTERSKQLIKKYIKRCPIKYEKDICKACDVAPSTLTHLKRGDHLPGLDTLYRLCPVLGVKPSVFVYELLERPLDEKIDFEEKVSMEAATETEIDQDKFSEGLQMMLSAVDPQYKPSDEEFHFVRKCTKEFIKEFMKYGKK